MASTSTEKNKKDLQRNSALRKCFQCIVDRKQVNVNMEILNIMLKHELLINMQSLDQSLTDILPYMLVIYIRNWPGWQKSKEYYSGNLNFREWFLKFRQYIIIKLNALIKNGYNEVLEEIKKEQLEVHNSKSYSETGTQTIDSGTGDIAPFAILVECSPKNLSSIVFTNKDNDIILSHHVEPTWSKISFRELVNWPHIGVEFLASELHFQRFNQSEYKRFIDLTTRASTQEKVEYIEEIKIIDPTKTQKCYTLDFLWAYATQYMQLLRDIPDIDAGLLECIEIILEEFLKDIYEMNLDNTMGTNSTVLFNIGHSTFARNKKLSKVQNKSDEPEVGYCETFIPKMETSLVYFKAVQDCSTADSTFTYLNNVRKHLQEGKLQTNSQIPIIRYYCLFCNITLFNHSLVFQHLENKHGMEPHFTCPKCLASFRIPILAGNRWKHTCTAVKK